MLKKAYSEGTVAVYMDPLSLLSRLATSVPPPRFHTVRDAGVLAVRRSHLRRTVLPAPGSRVTACATPTTGTHRPRREDAAPLLPARHTPAVSRRALPRRPAARRPPADAARPSLSPGGRDDTARARGLAPLLREAAAAGRPVLGICVGMQLLFEESEEHGRHTGLGLLPGRVRRFAGPLPVPHMGWNQLVAQTPDPLLHGIRDGEHVYFVHSYYCDAAPADVLAWSDYGVRFPAVVRRGSVLGMQFHPEKSQGVGLRLVANFVKHVGVGVCP